MDPLPLWPLTRLFSSPSGWDSYQSPACVSQVFNISYNSIQGLPPIWMFADNVPSWAEGGIDIRVRLAGCTAVRHVASHYDI